MIIIMMMIVVVVFVVVVVFCVSLSWLIRHWQRSKGCRRNKGTKEKDNLEQSHAFWIVVWVCETP